MRILRKYGGALVCAVAMLAGSAQAMEPGDWLLRIGGHNASPKSSNHAIVNVDSGSSLTFTLTRMLTDHWGVELLAAIPFGHDINLNGGGKVGETDHLPPTLSLQYHFMPTAMFQPYVGAGLNYTNFFKESTQGALAGTQLTLDDSFGASVQAGFDLWVSDKWLINVEARYIDIESDASLDGASIGTVEIDPLAIGISVGFAF
jgi:outer membrane protein